MLRSFLAALLRPFMPAYAYCLAWVLAWLEKHDRFTIIPDRVDPRVPYITRYYVLVKGRKFCPINIVIHQLHKSDSDEALHNHPWAFLSLVLAGTYVEELIGGYKVRRPGTVVVRRKHTWHRVIIPPGQGPVTTLVVMFGRGGRKWYFRDPTTHQPIESSEFLAGIKKVA